MERRRRARGDHDVAAWIVNGEGVCVRYVCGGMRSYLFELQLGPPANVGIGVEGCYYATSNGGGIHLDVKMRAFTYRGKWVGLPRGTRGKGGSLRLKACVVRLLCGLRSAVCVAVRCGAVGERQPLIEDAPNKNCLGGQKKGHSGAAEPIAGEIQGSTDP